MPVVIPSGVEVSLQAGAINVKGPKGSLARTLPGAVGVSRDGDQILVTRPSNAGEHRALHGLTRTLIANMVQGVTEGFEKSLEIHGTGYRAAMKGDDLELQLGYSHPINYAAPEGVSFEVSIVQKVTVLTVRGADKEKVGQVAADLRALRKPDPYKQKGVRYAGEQIRKKAGKTAK